MNVGGENVDYKKDIYKNNLNANQDLLMLWNNYENFKTKLENYNVTIEGLTLEVLNLHLPNDKDRIAKKCHNTDNNGSKINEKKRQEENREYKLLIMYKLLLIKLRSLQIEQQLCEENSALKKLLESNRILTDQKQQLLKKINQNKNLQKNERWFKTKFKTLNNILNNISNKAKLESHFNSGYHNFLDQQYYNKEMSLSQKQNSFLPPTKAFDIIKNSDNKLDHIMIPMTLNKFYKEIFLNYLLSNNILNINSNLLLQTFLFSRNVNDVSFSLIFKEKGLIKVESPINNTQDIANENSNNSEHTFEIMILSQRLVKYEKMDDFCKIRTFCTRTPKLIRTEKKFQKIKNLLAATSEVIRLQSERINFYSFIPENRLQHICPEDLYKLTSTPNLNDSKVAKSNIVNKYIHNDVEKSLQKNEISYNLQKVHELPTNYNELKNKLLNSYLNLSQFNKNTVNVSVGTGNNSALLIDQGTQIDNYYLKAVIDTNKIKKDYRISSKINRTEIFTKKAKIEDNSNNFKETLKCLKETIQQCYKMSDEQNLALNSKTLALPSNKSFVKLRKKRQRNSFDVYNKNNYPVAKMPEMGKIYQIVVQNKVSEGINFQFMKSNEQILIINTSYKTNIS